MKIEEKYEEFGKWMCNQETGRLKFLSHQSNLHHGQPQDAELHVFQSSHTWHQKIRLQTSYMREYIFGNKVATIEIIKEHMLKHVQLYFDSMEVCRVDYLNDGLDPKKFEKHYSKQEISSGYASVTMANVIKSFWENLDHSDLLSICRSLSDPLAGFDLEGGRSRMFYDANVEPLMFSYLNSLDEMPSIVDESVDFRVPDCYNTLSREEFDALHKRYKKEERKEENDSFDHMVNNIIKNFVDKPRFVDKINTLKKILYKLN
jgi:hypothetical protein